MHRLTGRTSLAVLLLLATILLLTGCGEPTAAAHWDSAVAAYQQDDFTAARPSFEAAAQSGSAEQRFHSQLYLAQMLYEEGRLDDAKTALEKLAQTTDKAVPPELVMEAKIHLMAVQLATGDLQASQQIQRDLGDADNLPPRQGFLRTLVMMRAYAAKMGSIQGAEVEIGRAYQRLPPDEREPAWTAELMLMAALAERRKDPKHCRSVLQQIGKDAGLKPSLRARALLSLGAIEHSAGNAAATQDCLDALHALPHLLPPTQEMVAALEAGMEKDR